VIRYVDPTKRAFAEFRGYIREGPIQMLNLVRLREQSPYPDGRRATGAEAYAAFGAFVRSLAAFGFITALIGYGYWTKTGADRVDSMDGFFKNLSIIGGFLLCAVLVLWLCDKPGSASSPQFNPIQAPIPWRL
jgi:hypothetical protein